MRDYVLELVEQKEGFNAKLNIMREYLQAYILRIMHNEGFFRANAFLGGTALRFLHNLPRSSEDLDFSTTGEKRQEFKDLVVKIEKELVLAGYDVFVSYNDKRTVQYAMLKFKQLMFDAGISPLKSQNFSIKLDIDTNPPKGEVLKTEIVNKYFPFSFLSYDIPSLFAGKLHALLSRNYTKGRDFFDLGWYLSRWKDIMPNISFLQNALKQTGWKGEMPTEITWCALLQKVVKQVDWAKVKDDVEKFLDNPSDADVFTKENILGLLDSRKTYFTENS